LLGERDAFGGDVLQTKVELLETCAHQQDKVSPVYEVHMPSQKLGIHISYKLLQKGLFDLKSGSDRVAELVDHELKFTLLHVLFVIIAKQFKNH
jgi:hypothetical protein